MEEWQEESNKENSVRCCHKPRGRDSKYGRRLSGQMRLSDQLNLQSTAHFVLIKSKEDRLGQNKFQWVILQNVVRGGKLMQRCNTLIQTTSTY